MVFSNRKTKWKMKISTNQRHTLVRLFVWGSFKWGTKNWCLNAPTECDTKLVKSLLELNMPKDNKIHKCPELEPESIGKEYDYCLYEISGIARMYILHIFKSKSLHSEWFAIVVFEPILPCCTWCLVSSRHCLHS